MLDIEVHRTDALRFHDGSPVRLSRCRPEWPGAKAGRVSARVELR